MTTSTGLRRSTDRKVTNAIRVAKVSGNVNAIGANSFGLPSGKAFSCPGQTPFCEKICYAGKLEKIYSGVKNILIHNWDLLKDATSTQMYYLLINMIDEFRAETSALIAKGVKASYDFRIHWDGDFFSRDYAMAWAQVIRETPDVRYWVYTRSFDSNVNVIDILAGIPNLTLYLSADKDNIDLANKVAGEFPGVFIATVADTFAEAKETIVDSARKTYPCPENAKRIPLISTKGSACIACGICPAGRGDVLFSVGKK
jgi:Gene product 88